ncbi:MAG: polyphenol oxidase family protein [Candidatus Kerfeldbacteria bacterium]|nr:polyphenol oxidase family protein [Candidatus Kerfeldbacteria bacterium]
MELIDQWRHLRAFDGYSHRVLVGSSRTPRRWGEADRSVRMEQVHGTHVGVVTDATPDVVLGVDALVTDRPQTQLVVLTADCVPVSFVAPHRGVIGMAHAGWRGTAAKIGQHVLLALRKHFHVLSREVYVHLGPSISPYAYDVTHATNLDERRQLFAGFPPDVGLREHHGWVFLDLWGALIWQLRAAGVPRSHIELHGICTATDPRNLPSHVREGGQRQGNIVTMLMRSPAGVANTNGEAYGGASSHPSQP